MRNNWKNQETCHIVYNSRLQDLPLCNYVHQLLPGIRCVVELVTTTYTWDGKPLKWCNYQLYSLQYVSIFVDRSNTSTTLCFQVISLAVRQLTPSNKQLSGFKCFCLCFTVKLGLRSPRTSVNW